ncbi:MAG: hypothetical protein JO007_10520 [Alphaproteobacteria bacterium]|nr:hypothetical protein [Alphaproteobacteria bacterium]
MTIDEIITVPKREFLEMSGIGNTKAQELINTGITDDDGNVMTDDDGKPLKLETVAVGSRILIIVESWRRIVEHQRKYPVKLKLRGRK